MAFLDMIIDPERLVVLAMLADAGEESSGLLRFFDSRFDVAETPHVISMFLHKLDCLCLQRDLEKRGSHTALMLQGLRGSQRMVETSLGFKTFGGFGFVSGAVLDRCYARMAAWVRLVSRSLAAEFPSWEVLQAMGVFGLNPAPSESFVKESLARLSQTFGLNEAALTSEFIDFQRFAKSAFDKSSVDELATYKAWVGSLSRVRKRSDQRQSHPSDTLAKLLARYGAFNGASTTSVERTFAVGNRQFGKHRQTMNLTLMVHELKLRMEVSAEIGATLIRAAQLIWVQTFGVARRSGRHNRKRH